MQRNLPNPQTCLVAYMAGLATGTAVASVDESLTSNPMSYAMDVPTSRAENMQTYFGLSVLTCCGGFATGLWEPFSFVLGLLTVATVRSVSSIVHDSGVILKHLTTP